MKVVLVGEMTVEERLADLFLVPEHILSGLRRAVQETFETKR